MPREMTRQERIEARHWLQVLSEHAILVRNAMDPVSGVAGITEEAWTEQYEDLIKDLREFTERVKANKPSIGFIGDRNA